MAGDLNRQYLIKVRLLCDQVSQEEFRSLPKEEVLQFVEPLGVRIKLPKMDDIPNVDDNITDEGCPTPLKVTSKDRPLKCLDGLMLRISWN